MRWSNKTRKEKKKKKLPFVYSQIFPTEDVYIVSHEKRNYVDTDISELHSAFILLMQSYFELFLPKQGG